MSEEVPDNIIDISTERPLGAHETRERDESRDRHPTSLPKRSQGPVKPVCPRCEGFIPNNLMPGRYPGAISRVDDKTEICSDCGREEALDRDALEALWPVSGNGGEIFRAAANRAFERMLIVENIR